MYKAKVNRTSDLNIIFSEDQYHINNQPIDWDIISLGNDRFHIIYKSKSYQAELVECNMEEKSFTFDINGQRQEVIVKDKFDLLLEKMGLNDLKSNKMNDIKAPMPGLILSINIKEGDEVQKGDTIMILEAMKMENVLKSPGEGIVKSIVVKQGNSVEKNQVLINF
jgi:biotin carboxyl carrier protein